MSTVCDEVFLAIFFEKHSVLIVDRTNEGGAFNK